MNKLSVIIPVYNCEKYLERCLKSVINQTYSNLEIIIVDDGSTDSSSDIYNSFAKKDGRIKLIHKENGGAASARNAALDICSGNFVAFCDSDDFIDVDMYEKLVDALLKTKSDISVCGFKIIKSDNVTERICGAAEKQEVLDNFSAMERLFSLDEKICLDVTPCNKVYKTELFDGLIFEKGRTCEDTLISPFIFKRAKQTVQIKGAYYNYFMSENSVSRKVFSKSNLDYIYANKQPYFMIKKDYKKLQTAAYNRYLRSIHLVLFNLLKSGGKKTSPYFEEIQKEFIQALSENYSGDETSALLTKNTKIILNHPILYKLKIKLIRY